MTSDNDRSEPRKGESGRPLTHGTADKNFLESTQIAIVFLDSKLRVLHFTPAITQLLHLVETDVGRPILDIQGRIPIEELYYDARRVLHTLAGTARELTAPDTGTRYIVRTLPYRSIENSITGVVITFVDITAIAKAEERQRLLLAELQHRVRNTLGVVRSIARRSARTSATVEDYAMHLDGRLNAFARTQAFVTRDPEAGVDLEYMVVEELLGYHAREGEQLQISGPSVRLQPKPAEMLALALHELATNAVKYGALTRSEGRVAVTWQIDRDHGTPSLVIDWIEKNGPKIGKPSRRGFGCELLEQTLAYELKARTTLRFDPRGLQCRILIPLGQRLLQQPLPPA